MPSLSSGILASCAFLTLPFLIEYTWESLDSHHFPPPGDLVDIGNGQRMHVYCVGDEHTNKPTVLLDSGLPYTSIAWRAVQHLAPHDVRVCAYDRGGYAWSDPGPKPRSMETLSNELLALLTTPTSPLHGEDVVLVGWSFGGLVATYTAARLAVSPVDGASLVGLVLVDPTTVGEGESEEFDSVIDEGLAGFSQASLIAPFGGARGALWAGLLPHEAGTYENGLPPHAVDEQRAVVSTHKFYHEAYYEMAELRSQVKDTKAALAACEREHALGNVPLVVVTSSETSGGEAHDAYTAAVLTLSTNSEHIVTDSNHYIPYERPGVVVKAVLRALELVDEWVDENA